MRKYYSSPIANLVLSVFPNTKCFRLKAFVLRLLGFRIGRRVKLNGSIKFYGRGNISIGDGTWVGIGVMFFNSGAAINIGANCDIAPLVVLHTGSHMVSATSRRAGMGYNSDIVIGDGCWIGTRVTVIAGAGLGSGCVCAAGSMLTKKYESNVLLAGVPARVIRELLDGTR